MNVKGIFLGVLPLLMIECTGVHSRNKAQVILSSIEAGTDSLSKRQYLPNPEKSLYVVSGNYCNVPIKTLIYYYDINKKKVRVIKSYMGGKLYGNYFDFYETGHVKSYRFYTGKNNNISRIITYSESGRMLSEDGTPFVDHIRDEKGSISLYFSDLFSDSLQVRVSTKKSPPETLPLVRSSMQSFLEEANVKIDDDMYFLEIMTVNECSHEKRIYTDTLYK